MPFKSAELKKEYEALHAAGFGLSASTAARLFRNDQLDTVVNEALYHITNIRRLNASVAALRREIAVLENTSVSTVAKENAYIAERAYILRMIDEMQRRVRVYTRFGEGLEYLYVQKTYFEQTIGWLIGALTNPRLTPIERETINDRLDQYYGWYDDNAHDITRKLNYLATAERAAIELRELELQLFEIEMAIAGLGPLAQQILKELDRLRSALEYDEDMLDVFQKLQREARDRWKR